MRNFRHDIKQHYLLEKMLIDAGNYLELERYCNESLKLVTKGRLVSNTGNLYIDSIIRNCLQITAASLWQFLLYFRAFA